jgi:type VI secretion system protein ImpC
MRLVNIGTFLNLWISQYVLLGENAGDDVEARFPLGEGSVVVTDVPQEPGSYRVVMFLCPRFQLEPLSGSIRLEVMLPHIN